MEFYSSVLGLVDFSPTSYCLPKPLFLYGSMVLLSILVISSLLCTTVFMFLKKNQSTPRPSEHDWWLCMVINISVQYRNPSGLVGNLHTCY